VQLFQPLVSL